MSDKGAKNRRKGGRKGTKSRRSAVETRTRIFRSKKRQRNRHVERSQVRERELNKKEKRGERDKIRKN